MKTVHGVSICWKTGWHCLLSWIFCCTWFIFSLTASHVEGYSRPTSSPRMAGQSASYRRFMPASNTPTCEFKILVTLRTCFTPLDLSYRVYVVLFCAILLTLKVTPNSAGIRGLPDQRTTNDHLRLRLRLNGPAPFNGVPSTKSVSDRLRYSCTL